MFGVTLHDSISKHYTPSDPAPSFSLQESQPVTVSSVEKDYSKYPVLDGPPRVDDIVVYKVWPYKPATLAS